MRQVIVVEGVHDVAKIQNIFPQTIVISVNGSAIDQSALHMIKTLDQDHEIILAFDPDHAGERIRRLIAKEITHPRHVFLDRTRAVSKKGDKIGLEHMKDKDIIEAFQIIHSLEEDVRSDITSTFLYEMGLIGHHNSHIMRQQLSSHLHIGDVNGKTLLKRLIAFGYTQTDIIEVMHGTSSQKEIRPKLSQR